MRRAAVPLAGALLLVAVAARRLPPPRELLRPVATPFDRSLDRGAGPALLLLTRAAPLVPVGASVAVRAATGDPAASAYCSLLGASLLPGRTVVPADLPVERTKPAFVIFLGRNPPRRDSGSLLLQTSQGAVWKTAP